jgi:hypothetical protein
MAVSPRFRTPQNYSVWELILDPEITKADDNWSNLIISARRITELHQERPGATPYRRLYRRPEKILHQRLR